MTCERRKDGKFLKNKEDDFIGKIFKTTKGGCCVVLRYNNCNDVVVKFLDDKGFTTSARLVSLRGGECKKLAFAHVVRCWLFRSRRIRT